MKKLIYMIMLSMLVFIACESEDSTGPSVEAADPPEFVIPNISLPTALMTNDDPHAETVAQYGLIATFLTSQYKSLLVPAEGAESSFANNTWTFTWADEDDVNYKLTIEAMGDDGYKWKLYVSGTYEGIPITDVLLVEGAQAKDEKSNNLTIYDPVQGETGSYAWSMDTDDINYITLVAETYEEGAKFEVQLNPDQSGEFKFYNLNGDEPDALAEYYVWNADGSGEWWEYADGVVSDQGTW